MNAFTNELITAQNHLRAGRPELAEPIYRRILSQNPKHADAWNFLGQICLRTGRNVEAIECYQQCVALRPNDATAHNQLGLAWAVQRRFDAAEACFRKALAIDPNDIDAGKNLGLALRDQGKRSEAIAALQEAARRRPNDPKTLSALGEMLARGNHSPEEAISILTQAIRLQPNSAGSHSSLGLALRKLKRFAESAACFRRSLAINPSSADTHNALGVSLADQKRFDEAISAFRKALELRPNFAQALNNLGNAYRSLKQYDDAIESYDAALRIDPNFADAHDNRGVALSSQGRFEEAIVSYGRAIAIQPTFAEPPNNQGVALASQGRVEEAIQSYGQAIAAQNDHAEAHYNLGMAYLAIGDFERGWPEYEWRWRCSNFKRPPFLQPIWSGEDLVGKTIALCPEQGLGDTIQFIRYAPLVQARGGRVIFLCPPIIFPLLKNAPGIDQVVSISENASPEFDVHAPLLSLPGILGTTMSTIPASVPYLFADDDLVSKWREYLGPSDEFRVGIAWQGSTEHGLDNHRSFRLAEFEPLSRVPGVRLISLQRGHGTEQLAASFDVLDLGDEFARVSGTFMDTAALMVLMDLVIAPDTSVIHLAGALGRPAYLPLCTLTDWRWLRNRDDSPWYPTLRLFRQETLDCWRPVFDRMAKALPG